MDVKSIKCFKSLKDAISSNFEEDFSDRHNDIESTVNSFYQNGYCNEEEITKNGIIVFEIKKTPYCSSRYNSLLFEKR